MLFDFCEVTMGGGPIYTTSFLLKGQHRFTHPDLLSVFSSPAYLISMIQGAVMWHLLIFYRQCFPQPFLTIFYPFATP